MIEILKTLNPVVLPSFVDISVDTRVLVFTLLVATVTGLGIGVVAAIQSSKPQLSETLRTGGRGGGRAAQQRLRSLLVVSEVGLALVLLIGAGLMVSSFSRMQNIDPGSRRKTSQHSASPCPTAMKTTRSGHWTSDCSRTWFAFFGCFGGTDHRYAAGGIGLCVVRHS